MIPAGTRLLFEVSGQAGTQIPFMSQTVESIDSQVTTSLAPFLRVYGVTVTDPGWHDAGIYTYFAKADIATRSAHATLDDVRSFVEHAFYEATGYWPSVTAPAEGEPHQTDTSQGPNWLTELAKGMQGTLAMVAIGAVAVLIIVNKTR